jgi:hypothetical protein
MPKDFEVLPAGTIEELRQLRLFAREIINLQESGNLSDSELTSRVERIKNFYVGLEDY